ncbi:hypothetical protein CMK18_22270 [Candidatus Poribacteria bacterium]|nr:hypothetical protein [Candidatus Poribacteria bacterium]
MQLAGNDELYQKLSDVFDEESPVVQDGRSKLDSFLATYDLLISKGFGKQLAEETAIAMVEGKEPMAKPTLRFAMIYGDTSEDPGSSRQADNKV